MKILTTIIGGLILCTTPAFAGLSQNMTITGTIIRFDKKTVTLSQKGGRHTVVPRKSIPKYFKIKKGHKVSSIVSSKKILASIKEGESNSNKKFSKSQDKTR